MPQGLAKANWDKANTIMCNMKLNKHTDTEIIKKLNSVGNKQRYLKNLILADIAKEIAEK